MQIDSLAACTAWFLWAFTRKIEPSGVGKIGFVMRLVCIKLHR
jgi:hypothetical protein